MKLQGKSVMVTGGSGFIGSHLIDYLIDKKPSQIVVVDNFFLGRDKIRNLFPAIERFPDLKVYNESAANGYEVAKICREYGIDIIFNLAVVPLIASIIKPSWCFKENVDITLALCDLIKDGVYDHLVHYSSSEAYGTLYQYPMNEDHPLRGVTPYAASKSASDVLALSYWRTYDVPVSILRPFNNYGPRQNERSYAGVVPIFIKNILSGKIPQIHGDGAQTRDYIYVEDTARISLGLVESGKTIGKVVNIAVGVEVSINSMYDTIAEVMDYKGKKRYTKRRKGDVDRHCGDITLLRQITNELEFTSFSEGIRRTVEWYKQNMDYELQKPFNPDDYFENRLRI